MGLLHGKIMEKVFRKGFYHEEKRTKIVKKIRERAHKRMTVVFNDENCIQNISAFTGNHNGELPHYVTLNDFLERLSPSELHKVRKDIIYHLIRMKTFDDARFHKKWMIIVDDTWLQTYKEQKDEFCMCQEYKREDGSKRYVWYRMALETKIVLGEEMIISFDTEFIENNAEDADNICDL